jgi:hypothetical protein
LVKEDNLGIVLIAAAAIVAAVAVLMLVQSLFGGKGLRELR